ncbi:MAG: hypothetical protein U0Q18_25390 [Bryobacteraceae bacterium]
MMLRGNNVIRTAFSPRMYSGLGAPTGYTSTPAAPSGYVYGQACGMLYPQKLPDGTWDMNPAHTIANTMWVDWCAANPQASDAQRRAYAQQLYNTPDATILAASKANQAAISVPGGPPGSAQFPTLQVSTVAGKTTTSLIPAPAPVSGGNTNPATGQPYNVATMGPYGVSDPQAYGFTPSTSPAVSTAAPAPPANRGSGNAPASITQQNMPSVTGAGSADVTGSYPVGSDGSAGDDAGSVWPLLIAAGLAAFFIFGGHH